MHRHNTMIGVCGFLLMTAFSNLCHSSSFTVRHSAIQHCNITTMQHYNIESLHRHHTMIGEWGFQWITTAYSKSQPQLISNCQTFSNTTLRHYNITTLNHYIVITQW